jgi:hypothetical protein
MLPPALTPAEILQALPELESSLSLRELLVREERLVRALDDFRLGEHDTLKYVTALLRTHIHFIQNSRHNLDLEDEIGRISQVLTGTIHGLTTLGSAVLELLEERRSISRTFPDGYVRSGHPRGELNIIDDDDYYTV